MGVKRNVKGRNGWHFVFRDKGQTITLADYAPITTSKYFRGSGAHTPGKSRYTTKAFETKKKRVISEALAEFKAGKYIYADHFLLLCRTYGVKINKSVRMQCRYINELDVSIRTIRHRNTRGGLTRTSFGGIFSAIEFLIAKTLDI